MDSYSSLAECYDLFMEDVPYDTWLEYVLEKFEKYDIKDGLVLDLGCGTGIMTESLAEKGYDMIGVDISPEMLDEATAKRAESGHDILYLCQDMRELDLYGTVRAVVMLCDSINYILDEDEVVQTFERIKMNLDPGGICIFDFNTLYKYSEVIGDTTIAENAENYSFIWENYYHEEEEINEYDLTIFKKVGELYEKHTEEHYQRGYTFDKMCELVKKAGFTVLDADDIENDNCVTDVSERVHMVIREQK